MQITFIAPTPPDISGFSVRALSSYLRSKGHKTKIVFLPGSIGLLREGGGFAYTYDRETLDQITELCKGSDLIGVSFMSNYFDRAVMVTQAIKKALSIPVIWGGIHPSCKPEECLEYADMVCVGEGEDALLELFGRMSRGEDIHGIPGLWSNRGGEIIKNGHRPLIQDLDTLPLFDFSNGDHYIYARDSRRIVPLTDDIFRKTLPVLPYFDGSLKTAFRTMTDRGCPHRCSYCNVSNIKEMYKDDKIPFLRARSVEYVIDELVNIKNRFPFVEVIQFFDDTFFARPLAQIEQFAALYKERVSLPFYCQASPTTLTEAKLESLVNAGLVYVEMGIQTGSKKIKELYHRPESNEKILEVTRLLHRYRSRLMTPDYHIIIDNPWETTDDILETIRLLFNIPKPYGLCISSLVFFPGTELYNKAVSEGLIQNETRDIYRKPFYIPPSKTYPNFLIYLLTFQHFPKWILSPMISDRAVRFFSGFKLAPVYSLLYSFGEALRLLIKGSKAVMRGDWKRIGDFLRGLLSKDPGLAGRKQ